MSGNFSVHIFFQSQWFAHRTVSLEKRSSCLCIRFFKLFETYSSVLTFSASVQFFLWRYKIHIFAFEIQGFHSAFLFGNAMAFSASLCSLGHHVLSKLVTKTRQVSGAVDLPVDTAKT